MNKSLIELLEVRTLLSGNGTDSTPAEQVFIAETAMFADRTRPIDDPAL